MGCSNSTLVSEGKWERKSSIQTENIDQKHPASNVDKIQTTSNVNKLQTTSIVDYATIDEHARKAPQSLRNSVRDLVEHLSKLTKDHRLVARAIFVWITENISYDVAGVFGRAKRASCHAEDVMREGKCVCEGYANVMEALCREAGIPVKKIIGFAKGFGCSADSEFMITHAPNHAWNAIKLGNKWHLIDSTWGAGHADGTNEFKKEFDDFYFLTDPNNFIYSHFPYIGFLGLDMEECFKWQLLEKPIQLDDFNKLVVTKPQAFKLGVQPVSHKYGVVRVKKEEVELSFQCTGKYDVTYTTKLMYEMGKMMYEKPRYVFIQQEDRLLKVKIHPYQAGTYHLTIFGRRTDQEGIVSQLFEYVFKSENFNKESFEYPFTYTPAQENRCILIYPLQYTLKQNTSVEFCITSPYLNRVKVNDTNLKRTEEKFKDFVKTGNVKGMAVYGSRNNDFILEGLFRFEIV